MISPDLSYLIDPGATTVLVDAASSKIRQLLVNLVSSPFHIPFKSIRWVQNDLIILSLTVRSREVYLVPPLLTC